MKVNNEKILCKYCKRPLIENEIDIQTCSECKSILESNKVIEISINKFKDGHCGHCIKIKENYISTWALFFQDLPTELADSLFDHLYSEKYYFITQTYNISIDFFRDKISTIVEYCNIRGVSTYIYSPGPHFRSTTCFIFIISKLEDFMTHINNKLNDFSRYDSFINIPNYSFPFSKSGIRRSLKYYQNKLEDKNIFKKRAEDSIGIFL